MNFGIDPPPESDHKAIARPGMEQQKRHHRACVVEFQLVGGSDAHGALYMVAAEVQVPYPVLFAHRDFGLRLRALCPIHGPASPPVVLRIL